MSPSEELATLENWYDSVFSVKRGREEVLPAYNHKEDVSESTSRKWLDSNVSMTDGLKLCFMRTSM